MFEKGEEVLADLAIPLAQALPVTVGRRQDHDGIETVLEASTVFAPGAGRERPMPARENDGAQQQRLQDGREDRVARVDGIAAIAQLVGQADLPRLGMATMRAVEVRDPDGGPMALHHFADDAGATPVTDDVDDHIIVLEHPVPRSLAADAHTSVVRADDPGSAKSR